MGICPLDTVLPLPQSLPPGQGALQNLKAETALEVYNVAMLPCIILVEKNDSCYAMSYFFHSVISFEGL